MLERANPALLMSGGSYQALPARDCTGEIISVEAIPLLEKLSVIEIASETTYAKLSFLPPAISCVTIPLWKTLLSTIVPSDEIPSIINPVAVSLYLYVISPYVSKTTSPRLIPDPEITNGVESNMTTASRILMIFFDINILLYSFSLNISHNRFAHKPSAHFAVQIMRIIGCL